METPVSPESKPKVYLPLLLAICTALGLVAGLNIPRYDKEVAVFANRPKVSSNNLLGEILGYIDAKYVDSVDSTHIEEEAINTLLKELDPHTTYLSPAALKAAKEEMDGNFKGIGIEFLMIEDTLQVITPISGGPAEAVGILSGDKFIKVNDTLIAGVHIQDDRLYEMLRGEADTEVKVSIKRNGDPVLKDFVIKRAEIPVHCVTASYMLDENTAYLKLSRFNHNTHQEFVDALMPMSKDKPKFNLVLDLRGNPGGLLEQAIQVLSEFFQEGKLLVYTQGRADSKREYKSTGRAQLRIDQVVVLIDEGSASAAEIVAGAVQDHDRAWVIGSRSFGKGLVQEQYPLSNGGALRVTVARYYTPSGRCIQKDFTDREGYANEHLLRGDNDSTKLMPDTIPYYTGRGRKVYSRTGIIPDVSIATNQVERKASYGRVRNKISEFVAVWMEGKQKTDFPTDMAGFVQNYTLPANLLSEFKAYATTRQANLTEADWDEISATLSQDLKASIARALFGQTGFQYVRNSNDPVVKAAHEKIRKGEQI